MKTNEEKFRSEKAATMPNEQVIRTLEALRTSRLHVREAMMRKRNMQPSEKAMSLADIDQQGMALTRAIDFIKTL